MDPSVVDCRSLIDFCRSFEKHRNTYKKPSSSSPPRHRRRRSLDPFSNPFCDHSPSAAIDAVVLLFAVGAFAVLAFPCLKLVLLDALPAALRLAADAARDASVAYGIGFVITVLSGIAVWEVVGHQSRKCGNPYCRGLRKAVEFDIQLESEECLKRLPPMSFDSIGVRPLELGRDREELEAELKKMAPPNGRTVLIFRSPCGCPLGRMEVWGPKRLRRIKK